MFERLNKLVRSESVSLFIGAGFSREACAPSVSNLRKAILEEISGEEQKQLHKNDGLADVANYFVEEECLGSRNRLMTILHQKFDFMPKCMEDHNLLARIPHFKHIFTTNYDTLLEDSYPKSDVQVIRNDKDCAYQNKPFTVFKVHGDFTDPDSVVITSDDYKKFFKKKNNPIMWGKVKDEFASKSILFIGYSLEDENILAIIESVSKALKKNQKEMFLIAPGLNEEKQTKLKRLGVHYFDTVANVFLSQLVKDLEENITKDFEGKKISVETYSYFCKFHNIIPVVSIRDNKANLINDIKPTPGQSLDHRVLFTIKRENAAGMIKDFDFERDGEIVPNSIYEHIPCFRFTANDISDSRYLVNEIEMLRNFKEIVIVPTEKEMELSFFIPSISFFESKMAKVYKTNAQTLKFILNCSAFDIVIHLHYRQSEGAVLDFNFYFKNEYKNNNEAIVWIKVVCALFSGDNVFIQELSPNPLNRVASLKRLENPPFVYYKEYYEIIEQIEILSRKKFKIYENCTEQRWLTAKYVLSFLREKPILINCDEDSQGYDFTAKLLPGEEFFEKNKKGDSITIVSLKEETFTYTVNKRSFAIPFTYKIFNSCKIADIQKNEDGIIYVKFHYSDSTYYLLFSNKGMDEQFPGMKPFKPIQ